MDEPHKLTPEQGDIKTVLPDVVHSQQISSLEGVDNETPSVLSIDHGTESEVLPQSIGNVSGSESISEHIPSKFDFSVSESFVAQDLPQLQLKQGLEKTSSDNSLNVPLPQSSATDINLTLDASKHTASSPLDINAVSDIHYLSDESAMNVPTSGNSKELEIPLQSPSSTVQRSNNSKISIKSDYDDSLNEAASSDKSEVSLGVNDSLDISEHSQQSENRTRSGSEEIIKLDIRGQGVPRYVEMATDIIFGPPPDENETLRPNVQHLPIFQNMLSPFLIRSNQQMNVKKLFGDTGALSKDESPQKSSYYSPEKQRPQSDNLQENDILVEEIAQDCDMTQTVDWVSKNEEIQEDLSMPPQPKSLAAETAPETMSLSTLTTDYKTFCEEYHMKCMHLEDAISCRDRLIEELSVSLQQSTEENAYLKSEIQNLQHVAEERSHSEHDTIKAQISDFVRYQNLIKDDSTKFYSALMSGGSSIQSSNGEKDMEREEITVHYSRSDLRSSESSEELPYGFENKIRLLMNKFDEHIHENVRNKLRESIIQVLCDEINKMQQEFDTELKDMKSEMQQEKHAFTVEKRHLREVLSSVKTDNVDIEDLRKELAIKHEKEMENLRMYFEKKCTDMERRPKRSYSEDIYRGRKCASPLSDVSGGGGVGGAGGDYRRSRSAEPTSLVLESTPQEQALKQLSKRYEQQLEDTRQEHLHQVEEIRGKFQQTIVQLEEKIRKLQTSEGTEGNMSVYPQDIDLELEKAGEFEKRLNEMREEVVQELQEKIQVLLSDPDAEVSSWPVELVALRDKIHGEQHEIQLSSGREEGEADKWRQRRNNSFDQNRQLELVTKERDGYCRVARQLQRAVAQLVTYCARADDELNNTVLACLIQPKLDTSSRSSSPEPCKRVHFAPTLEAPALEALGDSDLTADRRDRDLDLNLDLSLDLRRDLEVSLSRLRAEARALLELAMKRAGNESRTLDCSQLQITELVEELERQTDCGYCEMHKKTALESEREAISRENILREQLCAAELRIAQLAAQDVIAEGYGCSTECGVRSPASPSSPHARDHYTTIIDSLTRERDDVTLQLEAANRQLRSTRQFVEEQATERETERDDYTRQISTLKQDNQRMTARLQSNARILSEVEQLETQAREMNQLIADLETRKSSVDNELKASEEKVTLLRDIISNLEQQLEEKTNHEAEVLKELEEMRRTIDDRDSKIRSVISEIESLRKERAEQSDMMCVKCGQDEDMIADMQEKVEEQCQYLEEALDREARLLERAHETCSQSCSERTEDVSIREQKLGSPPPAARTPPPADGAWSRVRQALDSLLRASRAALKRVADLEMQRHEIQRVAQEVRAERDVLQARMSSQALQLSSLSARLDRARAQHAQLAGDARATLALQLHDAGSELQRLKEEMECKDKQLVWLKQKLEEKEKQTDSLNIVYSNSGNPKDKIPYLERELSSAQTRVAQLEALASELESDKDALLEQVRQLQARLKERDDQLNEVMALKLEDEEKEKDDVIEVGKTSARTLSDIVSISDFDEQDLQMRRAELKAHLNLSGAPFVNDSRDKTHINRSFPAEFSRPNISSLNMDYGDHFDLHSFTPRADSLPVHLTSTQNKDFLKDFKRNINETTVFGNIHKFGDSAKHSTAQNIVENCSIYPNRDTSENKNVTIEPKKINFSLEPSRDNKYDDEFTSLRELGVTLDIRQENFPDILTQLKHEIKRSRSELEMCKSNLKNAEEQLCEFPALKEEVEELKGLLENTMSTMNNDKKFYENQLENFTSNKKSLEQRLNELTKELNDKSTDLHVLKEDILRRENMILELAKEKRNLTNKVSDLELKIDDLENLNTKLENYESENMQLKLKVADLQKLEQLVSEKNQQIDSLNQHLDRLDDMQRSLNDKTDETCHLKEELHIKSNELSKLLDTVKALKEDIAKANDENTNLNTLNRDLKQQLTKLEKEQENASLKLHSNESELSRLNSLNNEMSSKIDELKLLTDKLKDKETEIEIMTEDFNSYHEEIATLKEQLKMVSRSPSPPTKGVERKSEDRRPGKDKKELVKIRKQISLLQHELDFNKKELNDKAFELAKAKLDVTELRNNLSQANKQTADKEDEVTQVCREVERIRDELEKAREDKRKAEQQLQIVVQRIREESNVDELKAKLAAKEERCQELELELQDMKEAVERVNFQDNPLLSSGRRSPTAELELALRDQINYSHSLDHQIMEQILSASSDEHEDIPRLALGSSISSSSIHSSSSELVARLRADNSKLQMQVNNLDARLKDKDALIHELNTIRDKLVQDWQAASLRLEAEKDNSSRLKLLLDKHKDIADSLQNQDSNMIEILKKRLESAMRSETLAREKETELRATIARLQGESGTDAAPVVMQVDDSALTLARSQLEAERLRAEKAARELNTVRTQHAQTLRVMREQNDQLVIQLAEVKRQKQDACLELARTREQLARVPPSPRAPATPHSPHTPHTPHPPRAAVLSDALTEIETHKTELSREIASLKQYISQATSTPELRERLASRPDDEKEQVIRYLHGRCLRLESSRKALVWQKRYLSRVVAGYAALERELRLPTGGGGGGGGGGRSRGRRRFKYVAVANPAIRCAATAVIVVLRMSYLVRRRQHARAVSADCILSASKDRAPSGTLLRRAPLRRSLITDAHTHANAAGDYGSPFLANTPLQEPFMLSSSRGEVAQAYMNKLNLVSRCLTRTMDECRDVP